MGIRLGPIASSTPPDRLKFTYEYVVGYGSYGKKVPKKIRGPKFTVSVVNAKGSTAGGKKCKCNGRTNKLGSSGPDCESLYQGKRHCYVDIGTCSDGKRSSQLKTPPSDWSLLACKDVVSTLVYTSPELDTYDADTCSKNGGWGKIGIQGDGCYSNPVPVDVPVSITSTEFYVVIHFINNDRNMHLNVQHMNMNYATCVKSSIIQYNPCKPGVSDRWFPIPTRLRHDFSVVRGHGSPSPTARDIRSGNPHQESWVRLPNVAASNPPNKLRFNYEYVVGYGRYGRNVPSRVKGPYFTVSIVDAKTSKATEVYKSPELDTYDYDTCRQNGGWGSSDIKGAGCYSNPIHVEVPVKAHISDCTSDSASACQFYMLFRFFNNDRNMHLNEDGMQMEYGVLC